MQFLIDKHNLVLFTLLERGINRLFMTVEDSYFVDVYDSQKPIIPQIESFATQHNVILPKGWKVDISKIAKQFLRTKNVSTIDETYVNMWRQLFEALNS